MKKRMIVFIATLSASICITGAVFASKNIKLVVNGQEVNPKVPLQLVDGNTVGSIRQIAEALGASVEWNDTDQTIEVGDREKQELKRKVELLESSIAPRNPEEAANTWARGVMTRNGILQYLVLSNDLQKKELPDFKAAGWVTGTSSPWVDRFDILKAQEQADATWEFVVQFHYMTSTGDAGTSTTTISVVKRQAEDAPLPVYPGAEYEWCIAKIN